MSTSSDPGRYPNWWLYTRQGNRFDRDRTYTVIAFDIDAAKHTLYAGQMFNQRLFRQLRDRTLGKFNVWASSYHEKHHATNGWAV